jgi:ABC-2 type transport system permease protein
MFRRVSAIIRKEFIHVARDPRTLALALMQLLLFGYGINSTVDHIRLVVSDQARTADSRGLVQALVNSTYFDLVGHVDDAEQARSAINQGQAKTALVIPVDFSRQLVSGQPATAQLLIDGSDPNVASTAMFSAGQIVQASGLAMTTERLQRAGSRASTGAIDLRPSVLYNPGMESVYFMIPGLIGLILQMQAVMLTSFAIVRERERGTLEQLIVTPISAWELLLGKLAPFVVITFAQTLSALAIGVFWFNVPINGSLLLLLALSLVFLASGLGIGLLISTVSTTQAQAMQAALFVILPSILLSGFMYPRESMPQVLQWLTNLVPLTFFLQVLRGIMLKGNSLSDLWGQVIPLVVFGVGIFTVSALRFQKRLE